ncbi:type II CAAX prenyl endopeptidase Rce1 family protein [Arenimonas sp.]|uniref:CPBP family intramembrane glutamic endopeptidase n=1 Tax=Arenimonas sp. TaxID=1872635 RepID=UPI0039E6F5DD
MHESRPSEKNPRPLWQRIPVAIRAPLVALLILNIGQVTPALAVWLNLKMAPELPLFLAFTLLWLWFFWRYLDGHGWPRRLSETRRRDLRATALSGKTWAWSLLAGGLGMAAVMSLVLLTGRVADLPEEAYRAPFDLGAYPAWTVLAFFLSLAATAGVVEEAAFRGYMLSQLQRRYGWGIAIGAVAVLFYIVHLSHAYATPAFLPFFAAYSLLHGALVCLTRSILPSVILHCIGDFCILPMQYGVLPLPFGPTYLPYLVAMLLFATASVPAFVQLRKSVGTTQDDAN